MANAKIGAVTQKVRKLDGKVVKPCWYNGRGIGHGSYFAAMIDNDLVVGKDGKPIQFRQCGQLEFA